MFTRNQLVHAVLWPNGPKATASLIDTDGVEIAKFKIEKPTLGSELCRFLPADFHLDAYDCVALTLSGDLVIETRLDFDTVVVTERAEISIEDRMQRLERREQRRQRRQERELEELKRLREQEATRAGPDLIEDDPEPDPAPEPEPQSDSEGAADA